MIDLKELLSKLNPEQSLAAHRHDGAMYVGAGPGTGKTQLIACRVVSLLRSEASINPSTILLLTYTDAGVKAMRKRLVEFIGPEAYQINIHTFHGLCSDIIQDNLSFFHADELEPVSELELIEIATEIVQELEIDHILKRSRGDIYYEAKRLLGLFQIMKKEGWSKETVWDGIAEKRKVIPSQEILENFHGEYFGSEQYYQDFKELKKQDIILGYPKEYFYRVANKKKGFKAGDLKEALITEENNKLNLLYAAAPLLDTYNQKLKDHKRYDFDDMIYFVLDAFNSDEYFLLSQQERFQYLIVDEFQDTNGLQNMLIDKLMSYWDDPNILVVGDLKQCLYEFQGARISAARGFIEKYNPDVIELKTNYRSSQPILDNCKRLIENTSETGIGADIYLESHNPKGVDPEVFDFPTVFDEEFAIVEQIEQLHTSGVPYSEIAIIYRKHRHSENILTELRNREIPVNIKRKVNILNEVIIQQLIFMLRHFVLMSWNDTERDKFGRLFQIFHYPYFQIESFEVLQSWALQKTVPKKELSPLEEAQEAFSSIGLSIGIINDLSEQYYNLSPVQFVVKLINDVGLLQYCNTRDNKIHLLSVITTFVNHMKSEVFKNPLLTMADFLKSIDLMIFREIQIPLLDINFSEEGINFLTAHGAKGLEFDHVIIMRANRSEWEKSRTITTTYSIPDTLSYAKESDKVESSRRLFYVAMSRAKKSLTVTYPTTNDNGRDLEASQFIDETGINVLPGQSILVESKAQHLTDQLSDKVIKFSPELEKGIIETFLENFRINVSGMTKYLKCKLTFFYENVLKIPFVASRALLYGNGVHHAMEMFYGGLRDGNKPTKANLIDKYQKYIDKNRGQIAKDEFDLLMALGTKELSFWYDKYLARLNKFIGLTEYSVNILIEGIPAKIVIDRLEFDGNSADHYDYKTGKADKARKQMEGPTEKNPLGGDYWRQGVFYKLGFNNVQHKPWVTRDVYFELIDSEKGGVEKLEITRDDELLVIQQMKDAYNGIKALDFEGCGDPDCYWCNFDKNTTGI